MTRKMQPRAARTRAALVEAAAIEFAEWGYAAVSVDTVAATAESTKGALYFHFGSKADLARAVIDQADVAIRGIIGAWAAAGDYSIDALPAMVGDVANVYEQLPAARAMFRLSIEPEFRIVARGGGLAPVVDAAELMLGTANRMSEVRASVEARTLGVALAGHLHCYLAEGDASQVTLGRRWREAVGMLVPVSHETPGDVSRETPGDVSRETAS